MRGDVERTIITLLISGEQRNVSFALELRAALETMTPATDTKSSTPNPNLGLPMTLLADILIKIRDEAKDQPVFRTQANQPPARFTVAVQALKAYQIKPSRDLQ